MSFDPKLLDGILVCTKCHAALVRDADVLVCTRSECRLKFDIRDGIPNMLVEDASPLAVGEWSGAMQRQGRTASS